MLDGGRIVEDGAHGSSSPAAGLYHRMFTTQAAWYRRNYCQPRVNARRVVAITSRLSQSAWNLEHELWKVGTDAV